VDGDYNAIRPSVSSDLPRGIVRDWVLVTHDVIRNMLGTSPRQGASTYQPTCAPTLWEVSVPTGLSLGAVTRHRGSRLAEICEMRNQA
jgi:hypothetical protein